MPRQVPLVDHAERTGRHAVAAAVADVLLDDDRAELGAEERAGRADVEAGGVRAVLADVGAHQPAQRVHLTVAVDRSGWFCSMNATWRQVFAPSSEVLSYDSPVQTQAVLGDEVPLLAGDLAGLAADADRGVGEEADPLLRARRRSYPARRRISSTNARSACPAGAGRADADRERLHLLDVHVRVEHDRAERSFAASPVVRPRLPQW